MFAFSLFPEPPSPEVPFREDEPGAWLAPSMPLSAHLSAVFRAKQSIGGICNLQTAYAQGIDAFERELRCHEKCEEPFGVNLRHLSLSGEVLQEIKDTIPAVLAGDVQIPGAQCKRRAGIGTTKMGVFVPGAGSLVLTVAPRCELVHFSLHRDNFFRDSYRDDQPVIEAASSLWDEVCCAGTIAQSGGNAASCKAFAFNGVEYINDGQMHSMELCTCEGWTFRPLAQWDGPTYTYATQRAAWDDGRLERGDRRGLVVNVNRKTVVLDGSALFFDRRKAAKATEHVSMPKVRARTARKEPAFDAVRMLELF